MRFLFIGMVNGEAQYEKEVQEWSKSFSRCGGEIE
jgi:hypothetical protein